jgi:hypothetical protein
LHLLAFGFALMASYFSLLAQSKVTKRKGIPGARATHTRSLDEAKRNPGMSSHAENPRIPLRFIRATI